MDRLISEQKVLEAIDNLKANFTCYDSVTLDEVASHVKAIPAAEQKMGQLDILNKIKEEILFRDKNVKDVRTDGHCFFTAEEIFGIIDKYIKEGSDKK